MKLQDIADGALIEQFEEEFNNVIQNIADPNTDPKKVRKVTITISLKPNEKRDIASLNFQTKSTLVPANAGETSIYIDKNNDGEFIAKELKGHLPGQMSVNDIKNNNIRKI